MAEIHTISLFSNKQLDGGSAGTSQVIDLRNIAESGSFALALKTGAGTNGTCGTTVLSYVVSSTRNGSYVTPSGGYAIATSGTDGGTAYYSFSPAVAPYMKVIATQTGTMGDADVNISAELIVK